MSVLIDQGINVTCNDKSKGRGRPASGEAMSSAQRQKLRRKRLKDQGKETVTFDVDADVAEALRRFVRFKDETLGQVASRVLRDRLLRKR
jgi:hypothetical protein